MLNNIRIEDYEAQLKSFNKDFCVKYLPSGCTVYDIGAFRGVLTVEFAKLGYNVIAIEGSERNFGYLQDNTKEFPNVTCILSAISNENKSVVTRFNDCIGLEHPPQPIRYITLPDLIKEQGWPNPTMIKMDIEGIETMALHACHDLIYNVRPFWQLSVHETPEHSAQCVYDNFPGFVHKDKGGFDFNEFFTAGYTVLDFDLKPVTSIGGFNEYFLIP